jgi:hypothetical protein
MSSLFDVMTQEKAGVFLINANLKDTIQSLNSPALKLANATARWKESSNLYLEGSQLF